MVDYLQEFKSKRANKGSKPEYYYAKKQVKKHLNKDLRDTEREQIDEVKNLSRVLDEKAEMKLQKMKAGSQSKP